MTKPLDPELKAMGAMLRAVQPLDEEHQARARMGRRQTIRYLIGVSRPKSGS